MKYGVIRNTTFKQVFFLVLTVVSSVFTIPSVSAKSSFTNSVKSGLSAFFKFIQELFKDRYVAYGLTMVAYFIVIYTAYSVVLKKTKMFEGEGGTGLSGMGKAAGIALTLITILGLHAFHKPNSKSGPFYILYGASGYTVVIVLVILFVGLRRLFVDR